MAAGLVVFAFLSAYFFDRAFTPNPTSRLLPVITLVEDHTFQIDRWKHWTQDKAFVNGHYYSDKAPLSTLVVVPFYAMYYAAFGSTDARRPSHVPYALGNLLCGVLPFLFLIGALFHTLSAKVKSRDAVVLATLPIFGSFLFAFSGTYFGHLLAGALLLGAWLCVRSAASLRPALAGGLSSLAFLAEFPTALIGLTFGVSLFAKTRSLWSCFRFALAGLPALLLLLYYNYSITGHPLVSLYGFQADPQFQAMRTAYGFTGPQVEAIWGMAFGLSRGAFVYAPILFYLAYAATRTMWSRGPRLDPWITSGFGLFYLVISSYYMWRGGWSYGPRHLISPAFIVLFEGILLIAGSGFSRTAVFSLSAVGILFVWVAKATTVYVIPETIANPVFEFLLPVLLEGRANRNTLPTLWFGLSPVAACLAWIPLFAASVAGFHSWYRRMTPERESKRGTQRTKTRAPSRHAPGAGGGHPRSTGYSRGLFRCKGD